MLFFLGAHQPHWLELSPHPLFVSHRRLAPRRRLPRARAAWALDSGGFSELSLHGTWTVTPRTYAQHVRRYAREIGGMRWAAIQDWMCEPAILARTGLSITEHQRRTVRSYLELQELAPEVPWVPVLQGWAWGDHLEHVEQYARAGVDLARLPLVGVGSICRRQQSLRTSNLIAWLASDRLRLHGFGVKLTGLRGVAHLLESADSMAWSYHARRERNGRQNNLEEALDWCNEHAALLRAS